MGAPLLMFTPGQAAAIREAAVMVGPAQEIVLKPAGLDDVVYPYGPRPLRIGVDPTAGKPGAIRAMDRRDFEARVAVRAIYRRRPPPCRICGCPIRHGEKVISFGISPTRWNPWGRTAFIHAQPCEEVA